MHRRRWARTAAAPLAAKRPSLITYEMPVVQPAAPGNPPPQPRYQVRPSRTADDVLIAPGTVEITLPAKDDIATWSELDSLEAGRGEFPPAIEDSKLADRVLTWVRVAPSSAASARFLWAGINVAGVQQRIAVSNELLGEGDGTPDQVFKLSRTGVVPDSVRIDVLQSGPPQPWREIDDLMAAGPEVRALDAQRAPGQVWRDPRPADVFVVDAEAGTVRFGDGLRGRRPPNGARLVAHYDTCDGARGNVAPGAISSGPGLPPGIKPHNPLPTWGGADAESVAHG